MDALGGLRIEAMKCICCRFVYGFLVGVVIGGIGAIFSVPLWAALVVGVPVALMITYVALPQYIRED